MEIAEIERNGRQIHNFLGVYSISQLNSITIAKNNICLIVFANDHAIGIYVSGKTFEIYDPLGLENFKELDKLCEFIVCNAISRKLLVSSQIQSDTSMECAKIVLVLLLLRSQNVKFQDVTEMFHCDVRQNDEIAKNLFKKHFEK